MHAHRTHRTVARIVAVTCLSVATAGAQQTIVETFTDTRAFHPGDGASAIVTGVNGIEWDMFCVTRATYNPPNPGDTNFANVYNHGYIQGRIPEAVTNISFKARLYGDYDGDVQVFLNNQLLGVYACSGDLDPPISIDIAEPGTHNLIKVQFLRWTRPQYARLNIDDLSFTIDTSIHTPAPFGWGEIDWVHNGFGPDARTERYICWKTPTTDPVSIVWYGETDALGQTEDTDTTCTVMTDFAGIMDPFHAHTVLLTGLTPGTTYHYRCGSDSGQNRMLSFKTAPAGEEPFTYAITADVQRGYYTSVDFDALGEFLKTQDVAFYYQLGDLVQNGGNAGEWKAFFESGQSLMDNLPAMYIRGNHDHYEDPDYHFLRKLFPYLDNPRRCYSFEYANMILVAMDNTMQTETVPWLDSTLAGTTRKWKNVAWHTNQFSTGGHGGDGLADMLLSYLPLVEQYEVTGIFNGHSHAFEVTHPIAHFDDPPELDPATLVAPDYALANRSQGTIVYNGCGVNASTPILVQTPQPYTITGDTAGEYETVTLASVYADSIVYRETAFQAFGDYQEGDVVFTYKIVNDLPVSVEPPSPRLSAYAPAWQYHPATGILAGTRLEPGMRVHMTDMQGRTVLTRTAVDGSLRVDASMLPSGVYMAAMDGVHCPMTVRVMP